MNKRIISLIVVLVMVLGMLPATAFAVEDDTYAVKIYGHSAQLDNFKLYTYTGGEKGTTNLLEGVENSDTSGYNRCYETKLASGDYWLEGYDADGLCSGGIAVTVEAKELNEITPYRAYSIKASNSGWVLGTDYTVSAEVSSQDRSVIRDVEMGQANAWGTITPSVLCLKGDTIKITYTPTAARQAENYMETFKSATMTANSTSWSTAIPLGVKVSFQVPSGSLVDAGRFHTYYVYEYAKAAEVKKPEEGDWTYTYLIPKSTDWFYRVQHDKGVTYWNFGKWTEDTTVTISTEDLYIGSEEFTSDSILRYEKNVYDRADIYLNINGQGYMDMDVGESYELNVFRNWMAIEVFYNAKVALPDMHYTVIDMEGKASDLLTITPDEKNSSVAKMTANKAGTAVVLVTYDAMTHMQGQTSTDSRQFSAIWPECTGVFVVTVGQGDVSIDTNMIMERYSAKNTALDAEHDILFYTGTEGASFTFTPEEGCTITVNRAVISDNKLTYKGFTSEGVNVQDGEVTISGLTTGRHIIKFEKAGKVTYQVVTARGVSYEIQDAEGNALADDAQIKAGDTVYLQFSNLVNPAEKMSGAYNFHASIYYEGDLGASFASDPGGIYGVYDFSGNPVRQKIAITIPQYFDGDTYTLNGAIEIGGFSNVSIGGHRGVTYANGVNANYNANSVGNVLAAMPQVKISLAKTDFLTGTLVFQTEDGTSIDRSGLTITLKDASGNETAVAADGTFSCLAGEYSYVIYGAGVEYATDSVTVTVEGENRFVITLTVTSDTAWDGLTTKEPAQDEDGFYLIGTGAELAWFATSVNAGNSKICGKLTADIDLGGYPWMMIGNSSKSFSGTFDGDGHQVEGISVNATAQNAGFFGQARVATVKNLTVSGSVTNNKNNTAGLIGYLYNGTIENCISNVTVNNTNNYTGGLVGQSALATIRNCANLGDVTTAGYAGGIIGSYGNKNTIENSYNSGSITGTGEYIGGIVGNASTSEAILTGCYNIGAISGKNNVGGIAGGLRGATASLTDCYNAGTVTSTGAKVGGLIGYYANAAVNRCYYLDSSFTSDSVAVVLSEAQLKDAYLSDLVYGKVCNGFPALLWQKDVKFHIEPETGYTVKPTCTEIGYTTFLCSECGATFSTDYVDALGHDWCEDYTGCDDCVYTAPTCTETGSVVRTCRFPGCEEVYNEVIPATGHTPDPDQIVPFIYYRACFCTVCEKNYLDYDDPRMAYLTIDNATISALSMKDVKENNKGPYGWQYNAEAGRFESTIQGMTSTKSTTTISFTLTHKSTLSFDYGVSSESKDKLTIRLNIGSTPVMIANSIGGTVENSYSTELDAGNYTLTLTYSKDYGADGGDDVAWLSNFDLSPIHGIVLAENTDEQYLVSDATCVSPAVYHYSCQECGQSFAQTFSYGEVNAEGHTMSETVVEATCGAEGYTQHTCALCGYNYRDNFVDALEHNYNAVVTPANYDRGGFTTYTCANCGDSYTGDFTEQLVRQVVSVYFSLTEDDTFVVGKESGEVMALKQVDVPYFDLALYGLEDFYFQSESYGGSDSGNTFDHQEPYENKVTMLHLFIYATEVYYLGIDPSEAGKGYLADHGLGTEVFDITGSTGSSFLQEIWGMDLNLNYYLNYEYPLASAGWGSTSDQILLEDGDIVTLGHFTSWSFFSDPTSIFNYIKANDQTGSVTVTKGEQVKLNLMHAGEDMMNFGSTAQNPVEAKIDVYYAPVDGVTSGKVTQWTKLGTTNEKGELTVDTEKLSTGEYIIAMAGRKGTEYTDDICSTAGGVRLIVETCTQHAFEDTVVAPTCTAEGYTLHTCEICGYNYRDSFVAATGHSYADKVIAPTCTAEGYTLHTCDVCGDSYRDTFTAATGHDFADKTVEATCTTDGYTIRTCKTCDYAYVSKVIEALGHKYEDVVTAPTHSAMGYTTHTCSVCQHSYVDSYTQALEHSFTGEVTKEPSCTAEGEMTFTCDCGESYTEAIPMTAHTYTAVDTEPTCTEMGYTTYTCACGDTYVADYVNPTGHNYKAEITAPTCTAMGFTTYTCECGHSYVSDFVEALGHELEETVTEATCQSYGCTVVTCKHCDLTYLTEITPVIAHTEEVVNAKEATWHTEGYTGDTICAVCGEELAKGKAIPALGCPSKGFADVETNAWYHEAVDYAIANKLMNGIDAKTFAPNGTTTRSMMATLLYRMAGEPDVTGLENPFTDVPANAWYNKAVIWAYSKGIVTGATATTFNPDGELTREQLAVMLWRYADKPEADESVLNGFADVKNVGEYAKVAMAWAVETGLINGVGNQKLEPTGSASRAQIATILMRYIEK